MAESILTRSSPNIPEDVLDPIPVTSTTHGIKVTLKDYNGALMVNWPISCKDGSSTYNYTTNEKGQTIFSVNSGAANIFVNNYNGSYQVLDMATKWTNIDAPVGMTTRVNITMEQSTTSFFEFTSSKLFELAYERDCEIILVGGGGGGGGSWVYQSSCPRNSGGTGGGAGYLNQYNNQKLQGIYNFQAGAGGAYGISHNRALYASSSDYPNHNGGTGGTSYIVNTSYTALGGSGGQDGYGSVGVGGLGNGGGYIRSEASSESAAWVYANGKNSPVTFAGGGGAAGYAKWVDDDTSKVGNAFGGSPYGGNGMTVQSSSYYGSLSKYPTNGSRGGGGAGGFAYPGSIIVNGSKGGAGLMRINIFY